MNHGKYASSACIFAIIAMMDKKNYKYQGDDENLRIVINFNTDDFDVKILFKIDEDRDLVRVHSFLPFKFPDDKRVEGGLAACVVNYSMINGAFDYDYSDGAMLFRIVNSYAGGDFTEEMAEYMLTITLNMVDKYNDRFFALAKGFMSLSDFIKKMDE